MDPAVQIPQRSLNRAMPRDAQALIDKTRHEQQRALDELRELLKEPA